MKWVQSVDLLRWVFTRNEKDYRDFFDQLKSLKLVAEKANIFEWSGKQTKAAQNKLEECQSRFGLSVPIDYQILNPKDSDLYVRVPVKTVCERNGIVTVEIDTSFKLAQIQSRVEELLELHSKRTSESVRNLSFRKVIVRSRAYELIHYQGKSLEETLDILEEEFSDIATAQRDFRRNVKDSLKKYTSRLKDKSYMTFSHFLTSIDQSQSNLDSLLLEYDFMDELKRL